MISGNDLYTVLTAVIPLYLPIILAYGSVRWWKIFTAEQCSGISRFVAMFSIPFLAFELIHKNNPYAMNFQFLGADALQKIAIIVFLGLWTKFSKNGSLDWMITVYSLSTLPNTLIVGVPLLSAMYGEFSRSLMVQVVVMQGIVWNTVLLFLFEFRAARILVTEKFRGTAASIASFKLESDVVSLDDPDVLETESEIGDDGMLYVTLRKANSTRRSPGPRPCSIPNTGINQRPQSQSQPQQHIISQNKEKHNAMESHVLVGSSGVSPMPESEGPHAFGGADFDVWEQSGLSDHGAMKIRKVLAGDPHNGENKDTKDVNGESHISFDDGGNKKEKEERKTKKAVEGHDCGASTQMPRTSVMTRLILTTVWHKLIRNPNTHSAILGLICSLITFGWHLTMPKIIEQSISIISNTGLGMAMFSLGLFIAVQPKIISCGKKVAVFSMAIRFVIGPAVMAISSIVVGIRGILLQVAIVQAALPQGIVTFVYAKEYNIYPAILSTGVIFGMIIALPITLVYYIVLGL